MSAAVQPEWGDDLMAIADATGVNAAPRHPDFNVVHLPHPSVAGYFSNLAIELALRDWDTTEPAAVEGTVYDLDAPIDLVPVELEHSPCAGADCERMLCLCAEALCSGHVEQACPHLELLCDRCRSACRDCVIDGQDDAGLLG